MMNNLLLNTELMKSKRNEKGLTMAQMATAAGYASPSSYYFIESGKVIPTKVRVNRIARELGLKPKELIIHSKHAVANTSEVETIGSIIPVQIDSSMPTNQIMLDAGNGKTITIQISIN